MAQRKPRLQRRWLPTPENLRTIDRLSRESALTKLMKNESFIHAVMRRKKRSTRLPRGPINEFYLDHINRIHRVVLRLTLNELEIRDPHMRERINAVFRKHLSQNKEFLGSQKKLIHSAAMELETIIGSRETISIITKYIRINNTISKYAATPTTLRKELDIAIRNLEK